MTGFGERGWGELEAGRPDGYAVAALTPAELALMNLFNAVMHGFGGIVGDGPTRDDDLNEVVVHVHALQAMVLSQAACRAYPGQFRLLGETLSIVVEEPDCPIFEPVGFVQVTASMLDNELHDTPVFDHVDENVLAQHAANAGPPPGYDDDSDPF